MELEHISHEHPLILREEQKDGGAEVSCFGCEQPIWNSSYGCDQCDFFLHKSCAELPMEKKNHPMHPQHSLSLIPQAYGQFYPCRACGRDCDRFRYYCSSCYFSLHTTCVSAMDKIQQTTLHDSHNHPLIILERPVVFFCFACGTEHGGASYLCTTCGFWIHQKCASLPSTVKCNGHHHPLSLTYSLPDEYFQFFPPPYCDICAKDLNSVYWAYYCAGCRYLSHLHCATSKAERLRDCETEVEFEDLDSNLINLPVYDESVDAISLFIKGICEKGKYNKASEINHFSHDHPLHFVDKQIDSEPCSKSELPLSTETKNDNKNCNGCAQPISIPFYRCAQCDFFLHEDCAKLHDELQHPCHPDHSLRLISLQATINYHRYYCKCCTRYCNVFMFGCTSCEFYLDIQCASLPHAIRHDVHKGSRILTLRQTANATCSTCNGRVGGEFVFGCGSCDFILCYRCAILPRKFKHRFDEHPFKLTYSPIENHLEEYFCEICEADINPKRWYYHCIDCDQSLHIACIELRPVNYFANVKFGNTIRVDKHPHNLTFVQSHKAKGKRQVSGPPCDDCGEDFESYQAAFECVTCNFRIHYECAFASSSEDDCPSSSDDDCPSSSESVNSKV